MCDIRKELEISAKLSADTSEFDRQIESLQKKLRDIYKPSDMLNAQTMTNQRMQQAGVSGMGGMSNPGNAAAYRASTMQDNRERERNMMDQIRGQEKLAKLIIQREEHVKILETKQKSMVKDSKEEVAIATQRHQIEERQLRLKETYKQRDVALTQQLRAQEVSSRPGGFSSENFDLTRRYSQQGMYGAAGRQLGGMFGGMTGGQARGIGIGMAGVGGAMMTAGAGINNMAGFPMRLEEARGNAIQQTTGQDLSRVYGGKSAFEQAWMPQRQAAAGEAKNKEFWNRITDRLGGVGKVLAGAGAGMVGGGVAGSFLPGIGTAIGGIGGAVAGGIGAYSNMGDRNRVGLNPFAQKQYDQLLASERAKDFRETLENMKSQDPMKQQVLENYEKNYMRDAATQRQLGITDQGMYGGGGFLSRVHQGGFMTEQGIGMANSIIGAGGSARMGRQAQFGLGMERAGLTNAGGILGSLSGSIQSPEATKRATISIMSEAFRVGLDNTDFAEENRRFTQAAAQIIGRSGVTGEGGQDRIAEMLGQFMGERTNRGVESAQGAYERQQQRGSQLGGRRGALRLTQAMKDPVLSKFSTQDLTELLGARPDQLRADSSFLQSYAVEAGTTPEEVMKAISKVNNQSRFLIPGRAKEVEKLSGNVNKYMQEQKIGYSELVERSRKGQLPPDIAKDFGMIQRRISQEESGGFETSGIEAQAGEFLPGYKAPGATAGGKQRALDQIEWDRRSLS